jgi:hypothetical protein
VEAIDFKGRDFFCGLVTVKVLISQAETNAGGRRGKWDRLIDENGQ